MNPTALAASILLATCGQLSLAQAQPEKPPAPPANQPDAGPAQPAADPASDREALRARLVRRQEETRQSLARLERALKLLEEGEPTDRVREEAGGTMRRGDRRDGHTGPPRHRGDDGPPTRESLMAFLQEHNPELAARMTAMRTSNPELADRILSRIEPHFREIAAERDPEMKELRIQNLRLGWELMGASRDLGQALREDSKGAEAEQAREALRALLGTQFDLQVKLHRREIALLEERIGKLREEMEKQSSDKDAYIAEKLQQIEQMSRRYMERIRERHEREKDSKDRAEPGPAKR